MIYGLYFAPGPTRLLAGILGVCGLAEILDAGTEALTWAGPATRKQSAPSSATPVEVAMNQAALATYLNDHLAGSVVALELLDLLIAEAGDAPDRARLVALHAEIQADRHTLEALMGRLVIPVSQPRQVLARLTEKLSEIKLRVDDPRHGALRRLEALEAIALGIAGKCALWCALAVIAVDDTPHTRLDFAALQERAEQQQAVVEPLRLAAAREAFNKPS